MSRRLFNQCGDTLVEVLLATAVLNSVLFISWGITNRATQLGLAARQRVEMVNLLKEQAELTKTYYAENNKAKINNNFESSLPATQLADADLVSNSFCDEIDDLHIGSVGPTADRFYMTTDAANQLVLERGMKTVREDARIWIQYKKVPFVIGTPGTTGYVDLYVRGCWQTLGGSQQLDNSQFVVRLNL